MSEQNLLRKRIRFFFQLHWIKILVAFSVSVLLTSIIYFLMVGMKEYATLDIISKQRTASAFPFTFYASIVTGIFFAVMLSLMNFVQNYGLMNIITRSAVKAVRGDEIGVRWTDVIGMQEAKKEAMEVVQLIKDRAALEKRGAQILRGVLLFGPPGCGKTYLVKALATETNLPFLPISGSEFTEIYVGVGAGRVRKLFKHARQLARVKGGCIIFIDEIDALGLMRSREGGGGATTERNTTLNQLLVEMDGLRGQSDNIVVFGATNMPEGFLDPAVLRPGRFDRKIYIHLPDMEDRKQILEYYFSKVSFDKTSVNLDNLSRLTVGFSPAEIANLVRESIIISQRSNKTAVTIEDVNAARDRILLGLKRKFKMGKEERTRAAFYEAGRILVTYLHVPTKDVFKASIVPHGKHTVSVFMTSEVEDVLSRDKSLLISEIEVSLAGFCAEKIKFGNTSDTSADHLAAANKIAHNMVWRWGMGKSGHVGNFDEQPAYYTIAQELNKDENEIIESSFQQMKNILWHDWIIVETLAEKLLEKEELDYDQVENIFKSFDKNRPAVDKRRGGLVISEKERVAYYEAGQVVITYLHAPLKNIIKSSIAAYGSDAFSGLMAAESASTVIRDKQKLILEIKLLLSGYCAEKIKFGNTSNLSERYLEKLNEIAHNMAWRWGMGKSGHIGNFDSVRPSLMIEQDLNKDVEEVVDYCLREVSKLLRQDWAIVENLVKELIEKDELNYDQIEAIFKQFKKQRPDKSELMSEDKPSIDTGIGWADVIGMEETKQEAQEVVELIKDRARLQKVGGKIIKGLLMFGPPGCGKTYLAGAMSSEFKLPFLYKSGSEFVEMYVGVGAMRVRRMFVEAKELADVHGGCILFIDEIDALGAKRGVDTGGGGQTEYNQTLNQLLVEMDGLKSKDKEYNIVVIGATNMNESFFDAALLRPGRFDRKIYVYLPALEDRQKLFEYYLSKVSYDQNSIDLGRLARITVGYSPADISNIIHEAAILAVRNKKDVLTMQEISEAMERIQLGLRQRINLSEKEKEVTAYHEAGHAIITYLLEEKRDVFKVSIIPRKSSAGVSWSHETEESLSFDQKEALARIKCSLGGYVAEKIKYGYSGAGVSGDFSNIMKIAHSMVYEWGMGESGLLGNFSSLKNVSGDIHGKLDADVQKIIRVAMSDVETILTSERQLLDKFAAELLKAQELDYDQMEAIFKSFGKVRAGGKT